MTAGAFVLVAAAVLCWPGDALAQRGPAKPRPMVQRDGPELRPMRLTISGGLVTSGGFPIGDLNAQIRRNAQGTTPPPFTLFRAESEIERALGADVRLALALTRTLALEVGGSYSQPRLGITISQDNELDGGATVSEELSHWTFDVSGVYQLSAIRLGARARPYVIAGAGYIRQLHEGRVLAETGQTVHAGAGVRYWFRGATRGRTRPLGARAEVRINYRTGAIDFEDKARTYPTFSLLGFVGF